MASAVLASGMVDIEVLVGKHVNRKAFLIVISQCIQQKQKQSVVDAEFRYVTTYAVAIENCADHLDNLPHPVTEPTFDVAVDLGTKMLQALCTGDDHAGLSLLALVIEAMQPALAPEVKHPTPIAH